MARYSWVKMAPLRPTNPLSRSSTTPRSSRKFFTAGTSEPVLANACEVSADGDVHSTGAGVDHQRLQDQLLVLLSSRITHGKLTSR